ncbi:trypsin-3-like [Belonocnema kinseyi]|uniref:trypsin-3-like n=1 Tax=Belonocnema kinseyi TaxID=2817044 RepID=UPI00143DD1EE|nr:trypsin-3-like [Belonocnema kinseyi]
MKQKQREISLGFLLVVCFLCESVFGQAPPIFASGNQNPTPSSPTPYIVSNPGVPSTNRVCSCVVSGTCTGIIVNPGAGSIDIRIVNQGSTGTGGTTTCPGGYVLCCTNGSGSVIDSTCGRRKYTSSTALPIGQAAYGAYPWQVALLHPTTHQFLGAGVLIKENYILTAAHKIYNLGYNFIIRLGEWNSATNVEPYIDASPSAVSIHPNFNAQNLHNDIAVVRLDKNIAIASYANINTACLPTNNPTAGTRCWASGWGVNAFTGGTYQSIMKEVDLPIVDYNTCQNQLRATRLGQYFQLDSTSFICAGGEAGKDACTGDGGGPLVCQQATGQFQVVGLTAWGVGCAQVNVPAAYVHIYNYLSWIKQQTG